MLDSEILDEMSCMVGEDELERLEAGGGMGNSWVGRITVDHSGSKWKRGTARITDHKFQARQGAANRDGSSEMGGWYGLIHDRTPIV